MPGRPPQLIGIAGGSGAGKTAVALALANRLEGGAVTLPLDAYYRDSGKSTQDRRPQPNFGSPEAFDRALLIAHLRALSRGDAVDRPIYDFVTHRRQAETIRVTPPAFVIVEGLLTFHWAETRELCHPRIFLDAPGALRLSRRVARAPPAIRSWYGYHRTRSSDLPRGTPRRSYASAAIIASRLPNKRPRARRRISQKMTRTVDVEPRLHEVSRSRFSQAFLCLLPRSSLTVVSVAAHCLVFVSAAGAQEGSGVKGGSGAAPARTVAAMPFVNISGRAVDDWIGAGIGATVEVDLERLEGVSVIGAAAFAATAGTLGWSWPVRDADFDESEEVARAVGRRLGVGWLLGGSFQRIGDELRITARFVAVESGAIGASAKISGAFDDLFSLQDRIVDELGLGFGPISPPDGMARVDARLRSRSSLTDVNGRDAPTRSAMPPVSTVTGGIAIDDPTLPAAGAAGFSIAAAAGILTGRPTVRPPRTATRPEIDGRLDDVVWRNAVRISDFVQQSPVEGAVATEETDVYIAYDSQNLYFGIYAHYRDPAIMRANRVDRDQAFNDDNISVYFDTFIDQQRAYVFTVNGYGVQGDSVMNARGSSGRGGRGGRGGGGGRSGGGLGGGGEIPTGDSSWDALFESGGQMADDGFTAEMAIPFKSLRYPQSGDGISHRWGLQIVREVHGRDESLVWAPVTRSIASFLPQMGILDGMTDLSTSRNVEIMPTFTGVQFGSLDQVGAFADGDPSPEGGINLKYGITSNLTADVTYNPDFSQIESDLPQIDVNERFALFFPELRPFFLEGAEIFEMRGPVTLVHTRTIVDPRFGGKVTGKVGKTTLGVLVANDEAPGRFADAGDPAFGHNANIFVGRMRYDLYSESHVGTVFHESRVPRQPQPRRWYRLEPKTQPDAVTHVQGDRLTTS